MKKRFGVAAKGYNILNLRLGFTDQTERCRVALWPKNLRVCDPRWRSTTTSGTSGAFMAIAYVRREVGVIRFSWCAARGRASRETIQRIGSAFGRAQVAEVRFDPLHEAVDAIGQLATDASDQADLGASHHYVVDRDGSQAAVP